MLTLRTTQQTQSGVIAIKAVHNGTRGNLGTVLYCPKYCSVLETRKKTQNLTQGTCASVHRTITHGIDMDNAYTIYQ